MLLQFKMVCSQCLELETVWSQLIGLLEIVWFKDLQDFEYVDILQSALCGLLSGFPLVASIHHANQMTAISKNNLITFKDCFLPLDIDRWLPVSLKEGTDVSIGLESHSVLRSFTLLLKYLDGIPKTYVVFSASFFVCRKTALSKCSISILLTSSPKYKHFPELEYAQHIGGEHQKTKLCHPTCRQDKTTPGDFDPEDLSNQSICDRDTSGPCTRCIIFTF